jgi:hypothetical protein
VSVLDDEMLVEGDASARIVIFESFTCMHLRSGVKSTCTCKWKTNE